MKEWFSMRKMEDNLTLSFKDAAGMRIFLLSRLLVGISPQNGRDRNQRC